MALFWGLVPASRDGHGVLGPKPSPCSCFPCWETLWREVGPVPPVGEQAVWVLVLGLHLGACRGQLVTRTVVLDLGVGKARRHFSHWPELGSMAHVRTSCIVGSRRAAKKPSVHVVVWFLWGPDTVVSLSFVSGVPENRACALFGPLRTGVDTLTTS